jgi:hypothetical protein
MYWFCAPPVQSAKEALQTCFVPVEFTVDYFLKTVMSVCWYAIEGMSGTLEDDTFSQNASFLVEISIAVLLHYFKVDLKTNKTKYSQQFVMKCARTQILDTF